MGNCVIRPIPLFESPMDKSLMTYRMNIGQTIRSVGYVWLIDGLDEKILVDAGASVRYLTTVRGIHAEEIQTLEQGLSNLGLGFEDIDAVIFTHLHNDHTAEARQFSRAKFFVQKVELEFARKPHPSVASMFNYEFVRGLDFELLNGDAQICEEVSVLYTPGHTPGGQSVCVRTNQGKVIISGLCTIKEVFYPPPSVEKIMPVLTPGMHIDVFQSYDSVLRIKQLADIVVPNHDADFETVPCIPQRCQEEQPKGGRRCCPQ
jgi:N-acyl homoserine lactone hydrolase